MDILDQAKQDMPFTPAFLKLGSAAEIAQRENSQKAQSTPESLAAQRAKAAAAAVLQKRGMNMQGNEVSPAKEVINVVNKLVVTDIHGIDRILLGHNVFTLIFLIEKRHYFAEQSYF